MEKDNNGNKIKIYERLATLEQCFRGQTDEINDIKLQVNNHIPSQINNLKDKIDNGFAGINTKIWAVFISIFFILVGLVINFYIR